MAETLTLRRNSLPHSVQKIEESMEGEIGQITEKAAGEGVGGKF